MLSITLQQAILDDDTSSCPSSALDELCMTTTMSYTTNAVLKLWHDANTAQKSLKTEINACMWLRETLNDLNVAEDEGEKILSIPLC